MNYLKAFIAGFLSTLIFHQGLLGLLYVAAVAPQAPYNTTGVPPLGVPQFLSLAFWGGVWGIVLWLVIRGAKSEALYWVLAFIVGAIAPSIVALAVVFPLKGLEVNPKVIVGALLLNGVWGLGVALLMKLLAPIRPVAP